MNRIGSALVRRVNPRFAWSLALLSAVTLCVMPAPARAQEDPPARVGRIADIGGDVFHARLLTAASARARRTHRGSR